MSRVVVVSGGGTGIGRAAARWFVDAGDRVWLVGRRPAVLESAVGELGASVTAVVADLSLPAGSAHVAEILGDLDIDIVVAAAGGTHARVPGSLEQVAEDWEADLRQNLMTAVLLVEALKPRLTRPGGRIIGVGSIGAQLGSGYGGSYGAAKAALHAWMYWLAQELGPEGVTANLVLPGFIPDTEFFADRLTDEFQQVRVDRTPVARAGTSAEVAATIGFLASSEAGYITGQLIGINGGMVLGR